MDEITNLCSNHAELIKKINSCLILPANPINLELLAQDISKWLLSRNEKNFLVLVNKENGAYTSYERMMKKERENFKNELFFGISIKQCSEEDFEELCSKESYLHEVMYYIMDIIHSQAVVKRNQSNMENVVNFLSLFQHNMDLIYALSTYFQVKNSHLLRYELLNSINELIVMDKLAYSATYNISLNSLPLNEIGTNLAVSLLSVLSIISEEQFDILQFFIEQAVWTGETAENKIANLNEYFKDIETFYKMTLFNIGPAHPTESISEYPFDGSFMEGIYDDKDMRKRMGYLDDDANEEINNNDINISDIIQIALSDITNSLQNTVRETKVLQPKRNDRNIVRVSQWELFRLQHFLSLINCDD